MYMVGSPYTNLLTFTPVSALHTYWSIFQHRFPSNASLNAVWLKWLFWQAMFWFLLGIIAACMFFVKVWICAFFTIYVLPESMTSLVIKSCFDTVCFRKNLREKKYGKSLRSENNLLLKPRSITQKTWIRKKNGTLYGLKTRGCRLDKCFF